MSITTIIALVRDAVILGALAWIVWFVYHAGQNADLKADMKMLEIQLMSNAKTEAKWQEEIRLAEAQRQVDMQSITAGIAAQRTPVIVRVPTRSGTVPGTPATPASGAACTGGNDTQTGGDTFRNVRPGINAFELEVEGDLATCRSVVASWP